MRTGGDQRLASIDALRGIAALGVVLFHATQGSLFLDEPRWRPWLTLVALPPSFGFAGVYLFFVISGFCIHLRWARAAAAAESTALSFGAFWKARLRRLYPPYLVALTVYVVWIWAEGALHWGGSAIWDVGLHVVMLHSLDPSTVYSLNGVFWTLAIEEQPYLAYFLLVFLLVFLLRRLGWEWTLSICALVRLSWFALALVLHRVAGVEILTTEAAAAHWFVWALGALAVEAHVGLVRLPTWATSLRVAMGLLTLSAALTVLLHRGPQSGGWHHLLWLVTDPLWGCGFFVLLCHLVLAEAASSTARRPIFFEELRKVGLFSYSLYLTHELILGRFGGVVESNVHLGITGVAILGVTVLSPLSLVVARAFFVAFEQPFLSPAARRQVQGAIA